MKRNEVPKYAVKWMTLKTVCEVKGAWHKNHILYNSFYIQKYPEEANPQGQKVG